MPKREERERKEGIGGGVSGQAPTPITSLPPQAKRVKLFKFLSRG